jgi:ketosteroid isomerase-like protein
VLIPAPGAVARGRQEVRAALEEFLGMKGTLAFETRVAVATGDLAYLAGTWQLSGKDPDGNDLTMGATTAEVVRRQSDGTWRYVLDNAWGDQAAAG